MNTGKLTRPLRALGLMHLLDKLKFEVHRLKNNRNNQAFKKSNPHINLPPDYMLFESFQLDYDKYYHDGKDSALWFIELLSPYIAWHRKKILDWGCGPARMVRHLPELLPGTEIYGTDYNPETIQWCASNIPGVVFSKNNIDPPLQFQDKFFDVIYGFSIFTHLSEPNHVAWTRELARVIAPSGILLLTTHGNAFKEILTKQEKEKFESGHLIIRGNVKEGHRVYAAFHPPSYMNKLFEKYFIILRHIPGEKKDWGYEQDTWILKKLPENNIGEDNAGKPN